MSGKRRVYPGQDMNAQQPPMQPTTSATQGYGAVPFQPTQQPYQPIQPTQPVQPVSQMVAPNQNTSPTFTPSFPQQPVQLTPFTPPPAMPTLSSNPTSNPLPPPPTGTDQQVYQSLDAVPQQQLDFQNQQMMQQQQLQQQQQQQPGAPNIIAKHKRVFAVDPEEQNHAAPPAFHSADPSAQMNQMNPAMTTGQLSNAMGNLSMSNNQQQQPAAQTSGEAIPLSIDPSVQCPPTYLRMTTNVVPQTTSLLNSSNIPFGCIIHPLARPVYPIDKIPVVNFGVSGIVRCRRCRSYINPFVAFVEAGRRWRCNFCNLLNDVPGEYYSPVDASGRRTDLNDRPELNKGVVEFIAPSEYMVRPPQPATYFFVIDVSYYSIISGMFHTVVETIKRTLDSFPGSPRTRVGFITFDSSVHFYNLRASLSSPQMLVVTDINELFLPLPDDLLVNLGESKAVIETLLNKLPTMFQSTQNVESALGVALKAAFEIMKNIGGKIVTFTSVLPSVGEGRLANREDLKLLGTDKESTLLVPDDQYYKNFALDCSRQQISVDTFLFSAQQSIDVATLGSMPQYTGGQAYYYPQFRSDKDGEKLFRDLSEDITRETGFEAVMRVRTSKGLKVTAHYGNFFIRSTDLLALPNVDADKAFGIQFALQDSTINSKYASIQSALLYTTSSGERRIRVFTQCLAVSSLLSDIFKTADVEAITTLTTKMALEKALTSRLSDAREAIVNKCIDILTVYKTQLAAPNAGNQQLLLPESLKLFPLYVLSLVKNIAFRAGSDIRPDERTFYMMFLRIASIGTTIPFLYPRLYALHNMTEEVGTTSPEGYVILPPLNNLSSEKLDRAGVFLLEDGQSMYMWVGRACPSEWLENVFGTPTLEGVDTTQLRLPYLENHLSARVNAIVNTVRAQRSSFMNLSVIREGEPREVKFFSYFVEDKTKTVHSYYEFLVNIHQRIQAKVAKK